MNIRQAIKEIVRKRGSGSLREVAKKVGIDHANLIRLMREGSDPRLKTIERIIDRLGYSLTLKRKEVIKDKGRPNRDKEKKGGDLEWQSIKEERTGMLILPSKAKGSGSP